MHETVQFIIYCLLSLSNIRLSELFLSAQSDEALVSSVFTFDTAHFSPLSSMLQLFSLPVSQIAPYLLQCTTFDQASYGLWSKVVHSVQNRVAFGIPPVCMHLTSNLRSLGFESCTPLPIRTILLGNMRQSSSRVNKIPEDLRLSVLINILLTGFRAACCYGFLRTLSELIPRRSFKLTEYW